MGDANDAVPSKSRNEGPFKLFQAASQSHSSSQSSGSGPGEQQQGPSALFKFGSHRQTRPLGTLFGQRGAQHSSTDTDGAHISSPQPSGLAFRPTRKAPTPFSNLLSQSGDARPAGDRTGLNGSQCKTETLDSSVSDSFRFSSPLDEGRSSLAQSQVRDPDMRAYTPAREAEGARKPAGVSIFSFNALPREPTVFPREPRLPTSHKTRLSLGNLSAPSQTRASSTPRPEDLLDDDQGEDMGVVMAALKDVSRLKGELNAERRRNRELSASLEHISTKLEETQTKCQEQEHALHETQGKLQGTTSELAAVRHAREMETAKAEDDHTSAQRLNHLQVEDLSSKIQVLQAEFVQNTEHARVEKETRTEELGRISKENKELRLLVEKAKEQLQNTGQNFRDLQTAHADLRTAYDQAFRLNVVGKLEDGNTEDLATVLTEVRQIRSWAKDRLRVLEPAIDMETAESKKLQELRSTLTELQESLAASNRVNDLLRDKLHHVSSQLAESHSRVTELEGEKHELWMSWSTQLKQNTQDTNENQSSLVVLKENLTGLIEVHEKTSLDALAAAAEAERKLIIAEDRLKTLAEIVEENKVLQGESHKMRQEIAELTRLRDDLSSRLASSQNSEAGLTLEISKRDSQIRQKEEECRRLDSKAVENEEVKTDLNKRLSEGKIQLEETCLKLRESAASERFASDKVKELQAEIKAIRLILEKKDENARRLEVQYAILEERLDAQAATLRLTKEHNGDLQERIVQTEASHAKQLESATASLKTGIALLQEQKTTLDVSLRKLQETLSEQRLALQTAGLELEKRLSAEQEAGKTLFQAEVRRSAMMEKVIEENKSASANQQIHIQELERESAALKQEILQRDDRLKSIDILTQDRDSLRQRLSESEGETATLRDRARTLKERYKTGQLSPEEKELVYALIEDTQGAHERNLLEKDNELRRRDKVISNLNARIKTLESTVARQIKERGTLPLKSMVDVNLWVGSSPRDLGGESALGDSGATPSTSKLAAEAVKNAMSSTPGKHTARSTPKGPTFAKLAQSDSEDDLPLSELSHLSTSLGKRPRAPSPTPKELVPPARPLRITSARSATTSKKTGDGVTKPKQKRKKA
ncbi:hypothetical protein BDN72DRAFT_962359 [Pluteus cervinus]|uniref:Uncharacterized protein n=1 Tax=Pluteus cervinus TaxID=181527 RepID=A0ACD3AJF6_9AGAR|nr:hypothetical protein BDN72DRAFT_962359 [Pluteus cervinus]